MWEEIASTLISIPAEDVTEQGMSQCKVVDNVPPFSFLRTSGI